MADEELVAEVTNPIIVDLGTARSKGLTQLKRGTGPLMDEVTEVIDEVSANLGKEVGGKVIVPVILIYRSRGRGLLGFKLPW